MNTLDTTTLLAKEGDFTDEGALLPGPGRVKSFLLTGALGLSALTGTGSVAVEVPHRLVGTSTAVTGVGGFSHALQLRRSSAEAVADLHNRSGLSWEQIARLFAVSRRAVHKWVAGGAMNAHNSARLAELTAAIDRLAGSPRHVRSQLLTPRSDGRTLFADLLGQDREPALIDGYRVGDRLGGLRDGEVTVTGAWVDDPDLEAAWAQQSR